jgi:hypothetical protein
MTGFPEDSRLLAEGIDEGLLMELQALECRSPANRPVSLLRLPVGRRYDGLGRTRLATDFSTDLEQLVALSVAPAETGCDRRIVARYIGRQVLERGADGT